MQLSGETRFGQPMAWEEYVAHQAPPASEYIDGRLIMVPPPSQGHQRSCQHVFMVLQAALPDGVDVTLGWGWKPGADEFVPDVMVHPRTDEQARFTGTPLLLVEVLSGNRAHDLVRKSAKYAAAGAPHYWILDPHDRCLDAYDLRHGFYEPAAHLEAGQTARLSFAGITVDIDLAAVLS
jgi:Uma2 family endonuclease